MAPGRGTPTSLPHARRADDAIEPGDEAQKLANYACPYCTKRASLAPGLHATRHPQLLFPTRRARRWPFVSRHGELTYAMMPLRHAHGASAPASTSHGRPAAGLPRARRSWQSFLDRGTSPRSSSRASQAADATPAVHVRPAELQDVQQLHAIEQLCEPLGGAGWSVKDIQVGAARLRLRPNLPARPPARPPVPPSFQPHAHHPGPPA
jgi:hypothetical protein